MDNEYISITKAVNISGKHITTIYTAIRKGKLKTIDAIENSKVIKKVLKSDLIRLFKLDIRKRYSDAIENPNNAIVNSIENSNNATANIQANSTENSNNTIANSIVTIENYKKAIEEVLEAKQSQLMKPMEEQALYRCGLLENEVKHLQAEKETLRQENEILREQVKSLPDKTYIEKIQSESQEKEKDLIIQIEMERKEKEDLKTMTETIRHELEEKHRLELEKVKTQVGREKQEALTILQSQILDIQKEKEALQIQTEKEKKEAEEREKQMADAWRKELEEARKPWWKFW